MKQEITSVKETPQGLISFLEAVISAGFKVDSVIPTTRYINDIILYVIITSK